MEVLILHHYLGKSLVYTKMNASNISNFVEIFRNHVLLDSNECNQNDFSGLVHFLSNDPKILFAKD